MRDESVVVWVVTIAAGDDRLEPSSAIVGVFTTEAQAAQGRSSQRAANGVRGAVHAR